MIKNSNYFKDKLRYTPLFNFINDIKQKRFYKKWVANGMPSPAPYLVKHNTIKGYARMYSISTFVETGTFLGATINALKDTFSEIYSIELNEELFKYTKDKFSKCKNIEIIQGDSGRVKRIS